LIEKGERCAKRNGKGKHIYGYRLEKRRGRGLGQSPSAPIVGRLGGGGLKDMKEGGERGSS